MTNIEARPVKAASENAPARIETRVFNEIGVAGFAHVDLEVLFFTQVAALLRPDHVVLDFGAGRGEWFLDDPVPYRRWLQNFRGRCKHVDGCDVDPVVLNNPSLDAAALIEFGKRLPYPDDYFDLIISRYVFEHVQDAEWTARELLRITKPGGWICAMTPNKWGYAALIARLVPNSLHRHVLRWVQPTRKEEDIFPTAYLLNTPSAARRHFGHAADVYYYSSSGVPAYHFGNIILFRAQLLLHRLLPKALNLGINFFIRKR